MFLSGGDRMKKWEDLGFPCLLQGSYIFFEVVLFFRRKLSCLFDSVGEKLERAFATRTVSAMMEEGNRPCICLEY